jgi:hypothetical protein
MAPCNGFVISIFLFLLTTPFSSQAQEKNCRKMDVTVDIIPSANGNGRTLKVTTTDNNLKFDLHLISAGIHAGEIQRTKITTGQIENVPAGTYDLIIQSRSRVYCTETRTVTVN